MKQNATSTCLDHALSYLSCCFATYPISLTSQVLPPTSEGSAPYPRHAMTPPASMPPDSTPVTPVSRLGSEQHLAIRRLSEVPRPRSYSTGAAMGVAKPPSAPFHNNWKLRVFEQVRIAQLTVWPRDNVVLGLHNVESYS